MADPLDRKSYRDIEELIALTGLSRATIWRLKRKGLIPFFQPGGKGSRVVFPEDAIEQMERRATPTPESRDTEQMPPKKLPGPKPKWMVSSDHTP
jgi:predicted DNA-binding transcriptional regulator AlpA